MAFPVEWLHRIPVTIAASHITATLTNFTLVFDQQYTATLTAVDGPLDADGARPMLNGGGDIRFSSDEAGDTQLACDVRAAVTDNTPANGRLEVAVKVPSISSSVDTTVYMWWGKTGESQPAVDGTFGQYNAYDANHRAVWPLTEDPTTGGAGAMTDRTSNQHNGTSLEGTTWPQTSDAPMGRGVDFAGDGGCIKCGTLGDFGSSVADQQHFSFLWKCAAATSVKRVIGSATNADGTVVNITTGRNNSGDFEAQVKGSSGQKLFVTDAGGYNSGAWRHVSINVGATAAASVIKIDAATVAKTAVVDTSITGATDLENEWFLGANAVATATLAQSLAEVRLEKVARTDAWRVAAAKNLLNTSGFMSFGSIENVSISVDAGNADTLSDVIDPTATASSSDEAAGLLSISLIRGIVRP